MPTVNLGNLRTRVYSRLEDNSLFHSYPEVDGAINDAVRVLNLFTGFIQKTDTVTTVANTGVYDVPSTILIATRVAFNGRYLTPAPMSDFGLSYPRWISETTAQAGTNVTHWVPLGMRKFAIYPIDPVGSNTLTVTGVAEPTVLSADADEIQYPSEFGDILEEYAAHLVMIKAGGVVAKTAMLHYQSFLKRMGDLKRYKSKINPVFYIEQEKS